MKIDYFTTKLQHVNTPLCNLHQVSCEKDDIILRFLVSFWLLQISADTSTEKISNCKVLAGNII